MKNSKCVHVTNTAICQQNSVSVTKFDLDADAWTDMSDIHPVNVVIHLAVQNLIGVVVIVLLIKSRNKLEEAEAKTLNVLEMEAKMVKAQHGKYHVMESHRKLNWAKNVNFQIPSAAQVPMIATAIPLQRFGFYIFKPRILGLIFQRDIKTI